MGPAGSAGSTGSAEPTGSGGEAGPGGYDQVLVALADPTRWQVLELLAGQGAGTATTLARELPVSRPAVIKHLTALDRAGLVASRRVGREVRYVVRPDRLQATAQWMATLATAWHARLSRLKHLAESEAGSEAGAVAESEAGTEAEAGSEAGTVAEAAVGLDAGIEPDRPAGT